MPFFDRMPLLILLLATTCLVHANTHVTPKASTFHDSEIYPGGDTSVNRRHDRKATNEPSANLNLEQGLKFRVGQAIFEKIWVFAPSSTQASDGLGPLYNARSCSRCHIQNGRGKVSRNSQQRNISLFARLSIAPQTAKQQALLDRFEQAFVPEPTYGTQLQSFAYPGGKAEGQLLVEYESNEKTLADGHIVPLQGPMYSISNLAYGPLHPDVRISPRIANSMHGLGLLEHIPESAIRALSDSDDADGDGISGKARISKDPISGELTLGRFGWKAQAASLNDQNLSALAHDIGISSRHYPNPYGDCTPRQSTCLEQAHGNTAAQDGFEASETMTQALLFFTRHIAPAKRPKASDIRVLKGKEIFYDVGCQSCHRASFTTSIDASDPSLANQTIWPYTDMLLHDMGEGLSDHRPTGNALGSEWRTAPLWGLGQAGANGVPVALLHDGRARSIEEAILWHGGEADASRLRYEQLTSQKRQDLLAFLRSL